MAFIDIDVTKNIKTIDCWMQGEKNAEGVHFDISTWIETYGAGTAYIYIRRNGDETAYFRAMEVTDGVAEWLFSAADTAKAGDGRAQAVYITTDESVVKKTNWYHTVTAESEGDPTGEDPDPYKEMATEVIARMEEAEEELTEEALGEISDAKDAALEDIQDTMFNLAPEFVTTASYSAGDIVLYIGNLYEFTADHAAGAWIGTDARQTTIGGVVADLKEELTNYNAFDIFSMLPVPNAGSHNGITFTWSKNSCAVSGTSTANAFLNFYYNLTELPDGVIAGCDYVVKYNTTNLNVTLVLYFYDANGSLISSGSRYITGDTSVHIPDNAVGMIARIQVSANTTVNISVIYHMINTKTNTELSKACDKLNNSIYGTKIDILSIFGNFEKTVHNGITFTPISNGFEINGTSNNAAYTNIYYDYTSLMQGLNPGDNLHFVSDGIVSGVQWSVGFFDSNQAFIQPTRYITGNTYITVPSNAVGMYVRLNVASGITLTNTKTTAKLFIVKSNKYYGIEQYNKVTQTSNGITYEWDESSSRYYIHGTANAASFYNMWHDFYSLPAGINPGDKILITFNSENIHIAVAVMFYDSSRNILQSKTYVHSGVISVPSNSVGMTFRFTIYNPYTANDYIYIPTLSEFLTRADVVPVSIGKPKYISFIDDDTSTDTYVDRYYQACMHNGIKGAYAVCTKQYTDEINNLEKLKQYEAEGFNLCLHCDSQERYLQPTSSEYNEAEARKNYIRAINAFRTLGLINCRNSWIIPYGSMSDVNIKIAKDLNFDVAFTTYGDVYNTIYDNNVYTLRRTGLSSSGDVTDDTNVSELGTMARCKARVNELANSDEGGWLVIMTHFNEWDDMTWNSNTDNDGYQIGYARFNEFVQYALSAGLTPISISEGVAYMKPLIERNVTRG